MSLEEDSELLRLAHAVADGRAVDWSKQRSTDPELAADLEGLRAIESVAAAMRRAPEQVTENGCVWLTPGRTLGRFRVDAEAGRGGMGIVYRARDEILERTVALKLLRPWVGQSAERLAQFTREAKLLASLNHPNIATIHGLEDDSAGFRYLVLEWVPGESLAQRLRRGALPCESALDVCLQIAQALAAAHDGAVIHRDLKPGNVMITPGGRVKLLDFGLARSVAIGEKNAPRTEPGEGLVAGTWGYLSPECLTGEEDQRADIFAFGCVLFECLSGAPAFPGASPEEIQQALLSKDPDVSRLPADTPAEVADLIARSVEKEPARRLSSILEAVRRLERALGRSVPAAASFPGHGTLPHPTTSFIGRTRELKRCADLLRTGRLVTVTGAGGCGKTRLALAAAEAMKARAADGISFVDLSAVRGDDRVVEALAVTLGEREDPSAPLLERIAKRLRTADALLVLDNCEHLLSGCGALVERLRTECPGVTILCTSREPLRVPAEQLLPLEPLEVPTEQALAHPERIRQSNAVRLFLDRATSADPEFAADASTLRSIAEICRRVEGLPLAVELAAARVRVLHPAEIVARLDRQLQLLRDASAPNTDRHRAMSAAIGWSVQQLRPEESRLFRALAVFSGGWDLEGAERVCGDGENEFGTLDVLSRLVDKSLVTVARRVGGPTRYRFLEPVRQLAIEAVAASGEGAAVRRRHLDHFLLLAEQAGPELFRPDQARWLARLDAEHENLLAALEECERVPDGVDAALRIVSSLSRFWYLRGHYRIGEAAIDRALARVSDSTSEVLRARALLARGNLVLSLGRSTATPGSTEDPQALRRIFTEALECFRRLGDRRGMASCLNAIGIEHNSHGDYAAGRAALEEACEHFRAIEDLSGLAGAANNLGLAAWYQRDLATARRTITESHALLRDQGDRNFAAIMGVNLAFLCVRLGDLGEGRARLIEALGVIQDLGVRTDSATGALLCAAELETHEGDSRARHAAWLFGAAQAVLDGIGAKVNDDQPYWQEHEACVRQLQATLGTKEYETSFADGYASPCGLAIDRTAEELIRSAERAEPPNPGSR